MLLLVIVTVTDTILITKNANDLEPLVVKIKDHSKQWSKIKYKDQTHENWYSNQP